MSRSTTPFFGWLLVAGIVVVAVAESIAARFPAALPRDYAADPVCAGNRVPARGLACTAIRVRVVAAWIDAGKYSRLITRVALPDGRRIDVETDREYAVPPDLNTKAGRHSAVVTIYHDKVVALETDAERLRTWDTQERANEPAGFIASFGLVDVLLCSLFLVSNGASYLIDRLRSRSV